MTNWRAIPTIIRHAICLLLLAGSSVLAAAARNTADAGVVRCENGAVVSVNAYASEIGVQTLQRGGSAVDAAVATAFALAVTYPVAGNIGGGGYMLVVPRDGAGSVAFDFREVAPAAAGRDTFVQKSGRTPHRRVGVPGTVRGLALAHQRLGKLPWRELVLPAVQVARGGFELDAAVATDLNKVLAGSDKEQFAALHRTFGRADTRPWRAGDRLVQGELADVLTRIADHGADGFYTGAVAQLIAAEMQRGGGLVTEADLAAYRPIVREPVRASYRGCEILAVPPSSSGGTTLAEELNILETFDLRSRGRWSAETLHLMIESMRRAYRDRAAYLGDPSMTTIPGKPLEKAYARQLAATIDPNRATPSIELAGDIKITTESEQTTHLSVIDGDRTAVSLTYTLESGWGSRVVVPGGGFLLNDEMNDFNWLPGVTNTSGRVGTPPNDVAPGKRMLSSMCPVVVRRDGRTLLITGSPGGRTIINTVLCMVVNVVDFDMEITSAVDAPRLHHGWFPDLVRIEPALLEDHPAAIERLREIGHKFAPKPAQQGDAHSIWIDPKTNEIVAAADRRTSGSAAGY
ncbi:MAG: gamma-glutamyltransferase [Pirellulales bacterium]